MDDWTKLEHAQPVLSVIVSRWDEETGRYMQPVIARLKMVWIDGVHERYAHDDDKWMPIPATPEPNPESDLEAYMNIPLE